MRNISTTLKYTETITAFCGEYGSGIGMDIFSKCLVSLSKALQVKLERAYAYIFWSIEDGLTPSEMEVLSDFEEFLLASGPTGVTVLDWNVREEPVYVLTYGENVSFTYMNLNTGRSVCFVQVYV